MLNEVEKTKALMLAGIMAQRLRQIIGGPGMLKSSEPASWKKTAEILSYLDGVVEAYDDIMINGIRKPDPNEGINVVEGIDRVV